MKKFTVFIILILFVQFSAISQSCLPKGIEFNTQAQVDSFQYNNPNCTEIEGPVTISSGPNFADKIMNLNGLSVLTSLLGDLNIDECVLLSNLSGLDNITHIGGDLLISSNDSITNLTGLEGLTSIGGNLEITSNDALSDLTGLNNLTSIEGILYIGKEGPFRYLGNSSLVSLTGLEDLTYIGGGLGIIENDSLIDLTGLNSLSSIGGNFEILNNLRLANLEGIEALAEISGSLIIGGFRCSGRPCWCLGNSSLSNLQGCDSLTTIGGDLIISCNDSLMSLSGLNNLTSLSGSLRIGLDGMRINAGNPLLTDIFALENIDPDDIDNLQIINNYSLVVCEIQSICEYIANPNGEIIIVDNAPGCNSPEEVDSACVYVSVREFTAEVQSEVYPNPISTSAVLEYDLREPAMVSLTVYNHLGQQIETLVNQHQQQGKHQAIWNPEELPAGIYFYRLQAGEQQATGKMVVLR